MQCPSCSGEVAAPDVAVDELSCPSCGFALDADSVLDSPSTDSLVLAAMEEFEARARSGERPDIEEMCAKYPRIADRLRRALPLCAELSSLRSHAQENELDELPRRLGRYEVLEPIGRGGMAWVLRAQDGELDRTVALKVLPPHPLGASDRRERFLREARAMARIEHPHVVRIHDVGEEGPYLFFAMELMESSLAQQALVVAGEDEATRVRRVVDWVAQAADGLTHLHVHGLVHRDLKPSNLLVGADGRVRVADLGLVRTSGDADLTRTGQVVGTLAFAAPEQLRGETVTPQGDIYALGACLHALLAGRPPGESSPSLAGPIPPELAQTMRRAMHPEPHRRHASAAELRDELRSYLDGTARRRRLFRRSVSAAVAAVLAGAVGALVLAIWWSRQVPGPTPLTMPPPERHERQAIRGSDTDDDDRFAAQVAITGDLILVGASQAGQQEGKAYVFRHDGQRWHEEAKLLPADPEPGVNFGTATAIREGLAIVGCYDHEHAGSGSGAAYVFEKLGDTWQEVARLTAADAAAGDKFGQRLSLSGERLLIGAPKDDDRGTDSGSAYVFERVDGTWRQVAKLLADDGVAGDAFGSWVSLDGEAALIGAMSTDARGQPDAGAAYVFRFEGGAWSQEARLVAPDAFAADAFGRCVSLSDDLAVVGAEGDDDAGAESGSAYVFRRDGSRWELEVKLVAHDAAPADLFGHAVHVSTGGIVVGAPGELGAEGSVRVFGRDARGWTEVAKLRAARPGREDYFGHMFDVSGSRVISGAHRQDDAGKEAGTAYVFELPELRE